LREQNKTVAVYEDLTCGHLAKRLQTASGDRFHAGFICGSDASSQALLGHARVSESLEALRKDPVALTDAFASGARAQGRADFGLALHAVADPDSKIQNLASGRMYISLTDGRDFLRRESMSAGRGAYDRSRMTLNAIDLLRTALVEGMK
jgi:nicotinamide mononucleotide (NMN) deamidase PncC